MDDHWEQVSLGLRFDCFQCYEVKVVHFENIWTHRHLLPLSFSSHPYSSRRTFAWLSSSLYPHWADASYRGQAYLYKLPTRCDVQQGSTKGPATLYFNNGVWRCCNTVLYVALLYFVQWGLSVTVTTTGRAGSLCYNNGCDVVVTLYCTLHCCTGLSETV